MFNAECPPVQHVMSFGSAESAAATALNYAKAYSALNGDIDLVRKHADSHFQYLPLQHLGKSSSSTSATSATAKTILAVFDIDATLLNEDDDDKLHPIQPLIDLHNKLIDMGAHTALITARLDKPDIRKHTEDSLEKLRVRGWNELHLSPSQVRKNMATVSRWKHATRGEIAKRKKQPIVLSVGDQWGDLIPLSQEKEIDDMDKAFGVRYSPYQLVRPYDGYTLWGLKLLDR